MRRPPRPYTLEERARILKLAAADVPCREIARRLGRERTSMERVLRAMKTAALWESRPPGKRRTCQCGARVYNDAATDYRFCKTCRGGGRGSGQGGGLSSLGEAPQRQHGVDQKCEGDASGQSDRRADPLALPGPRPVLQPTGRHLNLER